MKPDDMEESKPLAREWSSDSDVFAAFYRKTAPELLGYLLPRCGSSIHAARDIAQDAFLDYLRAAQRGEAIERPEAFLMGIAKRRLVDHYRQERLLQSLRDRIRRSDPVEFVVDFDRSLQLALAKLSSRQRTAIVLRYMDDQSIGTIAAQFGISYQATESLLARARRRLRRLLEREDDRE